MRITDDWGREEEISQKQSEIDHAVRREKKRIQRTLRCSSCNRLMEYKDDVYEVPGAYILSDRKSVKICYSCVLNPPKKNLTLEKT